MDPQIETLAMFHNTPSRVDRLFHPQLYVTTSAAQQIFQGRHITDNPQPTILWIKGIFHATKPTKRHYCVNLHQANENSRSTD